MRDQEIVGPVTAAIRAMRNEDFAEALVSISNLATDASDSVVASMQGHLDGRTEAAAHDAVTAVSELHMLVCYIAGIIDRMKATPAAI